MASSSITRLIIRPPFYVIISLVLFSLNKIAEIKSIYIPFIHSYMDDILFMPVALWFIQMVCRFIYGHTFSLNYKHTLLLFIYVSIMFELVIPKFNSYFVSDFFDVACYFLGSISFMLLNRNINCH